MGGKVGDPIGEIGKYQDCQHYTKRRERAQTRAEDLNDLGAPPA